VEVVIEALEAEEQAEVVEEAEAASNSETSGHQIQCLKWAHSCTQWKTRCSVLRS